MKILEMQWDTKSKTLSIPERNMMKSKVYTNKEILKTGVYNPLGLFTPVTLRVKLMLQILWKEGYEWDKVISSEYELWKNIEDNLLKIPTIKIYWKW